MTGFGQVQLDAQSSLLNSGSSTISAASDVRITTPVWTAVSGAYTTLKLGPHNLTTIADGIAAKATSALGARLSVTANEIDHQGHIELASGVVKLDAAQNLNVAGSIDTSGRVIDLAANYLYSGGGAIGLTVGQGDLNIQSGATLNISGSSLDGDAGDVVLSAANGSVILNGSVSAHAYQGAKGGSFSLDARNAPYASFSGLNSFLQNGGFNGDISIRQRQGDLTVAADDHVNADNIKLTADSGFINVAGSLDVSGDQAGSIQLAAGDKVQIHSGSHLNAVSQGSENKGGKTLLTSIDADGDGQQGASIAGGAVIDVSGTSEDHGGSVKVIVNRLSNNDAAVTIDDGTIYGADTMKVEAMAHYLDIPLSNAQIQQWRDDTQSYMDAASQNAGLQARLGGFALQPGLDIQSTGSLTLDLSESLTGNTWVSQDSKIWTTQLNDVAGLIGSLQQINATGAVKNLTAAGSSLLNTDGTYYFDSNPDSATFRQLFVRIFPNSGSAAVKYNPSKIAGNLVEHNGWDFEFPTMQGKNWRFGDAQTPGLLSLRSAADVNINQTISDGFAMYDASRLAELLGTSANWLPTQVLQTGSSWSYNIVAGADLQSANLGDVQASPTGELTIGSNTSVRTGTGNINMASAGDILLTDWTATIYTAGRAAENQRFFSRIQTLEGGNINLLAPGGMINAGLASAFTGQKNQAELGIVAQRQGDIDILVKGDLQVNQSRVFTLDSGDITVWSSEGNIDAGRGAKSAIATQRPKVSIDANGNLTVEFPATVSGSGIRAQSGFNNDHIGNVTLVAPRGVIDAGEAGIGGHDITMAAAAVIGASNIQAVGNTFGVPQTASTIAVPTGVSNTAAAATKAASSSALENDEENAKTERAKNAVKMALLDAQIIGFGSCSVADIRESKSGCGNK